MKYLFQFNSFEKLVVARASDNILSVNDAVDYGREFFDMPYEEVRERLKEMDGDIIVVDNGRIQPVSEVQTA